MPEFNQADPFSALDMVVMERLDDGSFRLVGGVPDWFKRFYPGAVPGEKGLRPGNNFLFLKNFLFDAEEFWAAKRTGRLKSGAWLEVDPLGNENALEATAVCSEKAKILLVELGQYSYREKQSIIQKGRELRLDYHALQQLQKELQKAHDELEQRVEQRTAELTKANKQLRREIDDRKRAEEALRESEEKYRGVVDNANDAVFIVQDEVIKFPNRKTEELTGYASEELAAISFLRLIHPKDRHMVLEGHRRNLKGEVVPNTYSSRIINKEGEMLWAQLNTVSITWEGRPATLIFLRDITQQKQLEAQLRQAHKMEAIGTLAGGIAHDFNNILAAILGYAELTCSEIPERTRAMDNLHQVLKATCRARDLVKQILAFSRQAEQERKPIRLGPIVNESLKLLRASIPTTIDIRQSVSCQSDSVLADPTQINQVLINLCTNAAHAMEKKGGTLEVRLEAVVLHEDAVSQYQDLMPGNYVRLTVSDTGHGIEPKLMDRIFDPYFTTKGVGEGTGMGLAVVHGIVKDHGGTISADSKPGKGATFNVLLPSIESAVKPEPENSEAIPKGNERILFVDDEQSLANLGKQMLESLGYEVVAKTSSLEALEVFRAQPDRFDLVVTDMTMPSMTGEKLTREFMKIRPDIPVILCTGFSVRVTEQKAEAMGVAAILMKPILERDIAKTVRRVLNQQTGKET